jgi:signal transduction histidine kinase
MSDFCVQAMNSDSKSIILAESSRLIGQIGNTIVLDLYARMREIESLTRTIGAAVERIPRSEMLARRLLPRLIDFQGDNGVAGGGIWPEPFTFDPQRERCSFFWGRDANGVLTYFDDYNQPGPGYHNEAWYVVGRYAAPGQCVWSASYMDPYSYQPMVTCTTPTFIEGQFSGVVTIDLKLEGLHAFVESWCRKTGGYIFIVDLHNRFITFPDPSLVKLVEEDSKGNRVESFLLASDLAEQKPQFSPLAFALDAMNQAILDQAQTLLAPGLDIAQQLSQNSYQITAADSELIAATLADPLGKMHSLKDDSSTSYLFQKFEIDNDLLLQEASTVFLFHVPRSYWKVVVVKPFSEAAMATYTIIQSEKMSSLGHLVAGVAHEINNPVNFIAGNLNHAHNYAQDLLGLIQLYQDYYPDPPDIIQQEIDAIDLEFLANDFSKVLSSMKVGTERIRQIVLSLRNFSRMDEAEIKVVDIHEGLDSTLLLLDSRLRAHANQPEIQVIKEYGKLPLVECYPSALNQVFMNLLINAIDALSDRLRATLLVPSEHNDAENPVIRIRTHQLGNDRVAIHVADNGPGIAADVQQRLFDPFFTTKAVGKGTGLGLSICYQIVTEKHGGQLRCCSAPGQGAEFIIEIPTRQPASVSSIN